MYKVIALFGPSGSGKDTLLNYIVEKYPNQFNKVISYTTRQIREKEVDGEDYFFISPEEFTARVLNGSMLEATQWCGNFYGSDITQFKQDKVNIGIFDEQGIECLLENYDLDILPIFIAAEDKTRLLRALNREQTPNCEKICQRFLEDKERFNKEFSFEYRTYYNGNKIDLKFFEDALQELDILSKND